MTFNGYDSYRESEILSADPMKLVEILYRAAIESISDARGYLARGVIRERSNAISKACEILIELALNLDLQRGGDIARNLAKLYDYMQYRLLQANAEQTDKPLAEVDSLLRTLLEGWQNCAPAATGPTIEPEHSFFRAHSF
jgi:flagellar protein FliS